ncbi:hypothetical protein BD769DRAFT_1385795 [Suillus cothurnatus]|jgi:hypothetical protein|nr:hypothetical protein BD769DRAFT_1385795 [Suillus cothurnatus]
MGEGMEDLCEGTRKCGRGDEGMQKRGPGNIGEGMEGCRRGMHKGGTGGTFKGCGNKKKGGWGDIRGLWESKEGGMRTVGKGMGGCLRAVGIKRRGDKGCGKGDEGQ